MTVDVFLSLMVRDNWNIWKKIWIAIEALVGIFAIFLSCTLFTIVVTWIGMGIKYGECTFELFEQYQKLIFIAYGTILSICIAQYIRRLYRKYKIEDNER